MEPHDSRNFIFEGFRGGLFFRGINTVQQFRDPFLKAGADFLIGGVQGVAVLLGPLAGGAQDKGGHRVEFVGDGIQPQAPGLKGNRAAASGNIQHQGIGDGQVLLKPVGFGGGEVVGESALAGIARIQFDAGLLGGVQPPLLVNDAGMGANQVIKGVPVGVGRQQRRRHRRPGRD